MKDKNHRENINKKFKESFAGMDAVMEGMNVHQRVRFMNQAMHELRCRITRHASWALENLAGLNPKDFVFSKENSSKIFNCLWEKNAIFQIENPQNQILGMDFDEAPKPDTPETDESDTNTSRTSPGR